MVLRQHRHIERAAFTLMEIIVVVTIILILAGSGIFVFTGVLDKSREQRAQMDVKSLEKAVQVYYVRHGQNPPDLQTLCQRQSDGSPALLDQRALLDPWNQPYIFEPGNLHPLTAVPHIYSQGPPGMGKMFSNWPGEGANDAK
jgi:general secretion pathway protein G